MSNPPKKYKTPYYSTNICLGEDPTIIVAAKSKGKGKKDGNSNNNSPFTSVQDCMKDISSLIDSVKTNLFKGMPQEGIVDMLFSKSKINNTDPLKVTNLKKKIEVTRDAYKFWKEVGDDERAKNKLQCIMKLEDEIEKSYDVEDK